jgi:cell division protein FtsZ
MFIMDNGGIGRASYAEGEIRPKIIVIGVGGAGGNAVNNMIRSNLEGVMFIVANTDAQALSQSLVSPEYRFQLGLGITQGLGAGSKPDVGRSAAEESVDDVMKFISGSNMVFITAGMGGGTGTGAAPVIAKAAREAGILTVGVVTKPFSFEGSSRAKLAEAGLHELQQYVDTLLVIPNQNLFRLANESTTFADAFKMADNVLYSGVRGVTDLMIMPGLINLDFADIRAIMSEMGKAMMGTGEADGDRRALDAAEAAISNPLLDDVSLQGASGVLINITGGYDMTLYEVDEAANRIRDEVETDANIIFGSTFDERLNGRIRVSVVATGIGSDSSFMKSRDISGIVGLKKQESSDNVINISKARLSQLEPSTKSENGLAHPDFFDSQESEKDTYFERDGVLSSRKTNSFFNRFTSRSKKNIEQDSYENESYFQSRPIIKKSEEKEKQDDVPGEDDLEIPACFRRKQK